MSDLSNPSLSANYAMRCVLYKVGHELWARQHGGISICQAKRDYKSLWEDAIHEFNHSCAYCGAPFELTQKGKYKAEQEHLIMVNKEQCGLHHPGNVVPLCSKCNQDRSSQTLWEQQLRSKCEEGKYHERLSKIRKHIVKHGYDKIGLDQSSLIRIIRNAYLQVTKLIQISFKEILQSGD